MPYTRPDRKGLPDPLPDVADAVGEMPRSESYLRLSELASVIGPARQPPAQNLIPPDKSLSRSKGSGNGKRECKKVALLTPPIEISHDNTPTKPSPPPTPQSPQAERSSPVEHSKFSSQRSSGVLNSPRSDLLIDVGRSPVESPKSIQAPQSPKTQPSEVAPGLFI